MTLTVSSPVGAATSAAAPRWVRRRPRWDAVVLAGGRGSRLGGADKAVLVLDGDTLLERILIATQGARDRVLVRSNLPPLPGIRSVSEQPAGGGPAAATIAGLGALRHPVAAFVAVLAVDQPQAGLALDQLIARAWQERHRQATAGWLAVDPSGHRQPLLAIYRTGALRAAGVTLSTRGLLTGASMRRLLEPLQLSEVPLPDGLCADIDTAADLLRLGATVAPQLPRTAAAQHQEGGNR